MRLVQFNFIGRPCFGLEKPDGSVVDVSKDFGGADTLVKFLAQDEGNMEKLRSLDISGRKSIPRSEVELLSPVTRPDKVICIGMNYRDHCEEQNAPVPTEPVVFNKFPSCIVGPNDPIPYPKPSKELDWEVELAFVISKKCRDVSKSDAGDYILGYTVAHDVSARDWQLKRNGGQWLVGKAMDAFCPLGPSVVTADELGDPNKLGLTCSVNGVKKQNSNTDQLVFDCPAIVEWVSRLVTLLPGDVILTGTPPGVGVFMKPPEFLKKGDVVECSIQGIGTIKNEIV